MSEDKPKEVFACEYPPRFGMVAVRLGFITPGQLREAMIEQLNDDVGGLAHHPLGSILVAKGWMTEEQIEKTLNKTLQAYPRESRRK